MDDLAPELLDKIIDVWVLADTHGNAMKSCALVCRRWLPRSRWHLFSKVSLTATTLASFVDLVESSSFPILSCIQHLELEHTSSVPDTKLLARLHNCPNLTHIGLYVTTAAAAVWLASHDALHSHLRAWGHHSLTSISRLDLRFGSINEITLATIIEVLSCVPRIETLGIYGMCRLGKDSGSGVRGGFVPSRLAHLDLRGLHRSSLFFSWLLSLPVLPKLTSLAFVGSVSSDDLTTIEEYFRRAGDGLESLDMETRGGWDGRSSAPTLSSRSLIQRCHPRCYILPPANLPIHHTPPSAHLHLPELLRPARHPPFSLRFRMLGFSRHHGVHPGRLRCAALDGA
jgi:hypothetical protein